MWITTSQQFRDFSLLTHKMWSLDQWDWKFWGIRYYNHDHNIVGETVQANFSRRDPSATKVLKKHSCHKKIHEGGPRPVIEHISWNTKGNFSWIDCDTTCWYKDIYFEMWCSWKEHVCIVSEYWMLLRNFRSINTGVQCHGISVSASVWAV